MNIETRKYDIKNKVFKISNLIDIAKIIYKEYEIDLKNFESEQASRDYSGRFNILIKYESGSSSSNELDILSRSTTFNYKNVKEVHIIFDSHGYKKDKKEINFKVVSGEYNYGYVEVIGDNLNWVNGIYATILEIVDNVKPHDNVMINKKFIAIPLISIILGISVSFLLVFIIMLLKNGELDFSRVNLGFIPFVPLIFVVPIAFFVDWQINKIWPSIEFDFVEEHLNKSKKIRNLISIYISTVLLPFIFFILGLIFN